MKIVGCNVYSIHTMLCVWFSTIKYPYMFRNIHRIHFKCYVGFRYFVSCFIAQRRNAIYFVATASSEIFVSQ